MGASLKDLPTPASGTIRIGSKSFQGRDVLIGEDLQYVRVFPRPIPPLRVPEGQALNECPPSERVPDFKDPSYVRAFQAWHGHSQLVGLAIALGWETSAGLKQPSNLEDDQGFKAWADAAFIELRGRLSDEQLAECSRQRDEMAATNAGIAGNGQQTNADGAATETKGQQ